MYLGASFAGEREFDEDADDREGVVAEVDKENVAGDGGGGDDGWFADMDFGGFWD